jgi:lysophospholipase L1-like esterase
MRAYSCPSTLIVALLSLVFLAPRARAQTPPTRIMPLGDSITDGTAHGTAGFGGYRGTLYTLLTNAGFNVDYVGTLSNNGANLPDPQHEGHSGWRIDQLGSAMAGWLQGLADPDVVLMHIGTNDFGQNFNTIDAINRLDALILQIATLRPYAHIIVTNLLVRSGAVNTTIQTQFNPFVQQKVDAHAALGRRVTFLDLRSAVPLADMPDGLHPNQTGYDKMANAWRPAIQAIITPLGDHLPPGISRIHSPDATHVVVTFSKPVADTAAALANYAIGGLAITSASLDGTTKREVTLTTSAMAPGALHTIAVSGIHDRTPAQNLIASGTTANFFAPAVRGAVNNVTEAAGYTLLYSLNLPVTAAYNTAPPVYAVDNHTSIGPFTRVAYYLELQSVGQPLRYCWVSMDAFTTNAARLGVPHLATSAFFQQPVTNMNVVSNVPGVTTGTGIVGGNLEFWSTNYATANAAGVPGASGTTYDFGDQSASGNYGSMQVHNAAAAQTLIAFNNWGAGGSNPVDLGIGNNTSANPDWTFAYNAAGYTVRSLQVFVQPVATPPTILFRDDFDGPGLDAAKWSLGTWMLGRTRLGNSPVVSGGIARLKFDTFNAADPSRSFRGTEIFSHALFTRGQGIELEARVRVNAMPAGLVSSFFTYVFRQTGGVDYSDEIDFEFLSKQIASSPATSDPVLTTTWNNWNNTTQIYTDPNTYNSQSVSVTGLNLAQFNTVLIRWLPDRVEWRVNGQLVRVATTAVPDEATPIRLNFWAPASGWTDAYSNKLTPAKNVRQNQTYYYDVDYVEVRTIP